MAKKQSKRKNAVKKNISATLPAGFTATDVAGSFGVTHDFHKVAVCTGKVLGIDRVTFKDSNGKKKNSRVMRIQSGNVATSVWESFQLRGLFDSAKKGKEVYIKYAGQEKIKGGKKVNLFVTGIK